MDLYRKYQKFKKEGIKVMAKAKEFTRESIAADVEAFKAGKFSKTNMTADWMDNYVAMFATDTMEEYIKFCLSVPMKDSKRVKKVKDENGNVSEEKIMIIDTKPIREYFIKTYFPEYTEEAIKAAKEAAKAKKAAEKAEKEKIAALSPEEKFRLKMAALAKK